MPIETPDKALTLAELPTVTSSDTGIQAIVTTSVGAKKLPLGNLFESYTLLIGSYQYYSANFPTGFATPMLGGILDPIDFSDHLQTLKQRIPNDWILGDGKVQLPLVFDHVLQQDLSLQPSEFQEDAQQCITGWIFANSNGLGITGGVFAGGQSAVGNLYGNSRDGNSQQYIFDSSRVVRTAGKNRENTLNALLCILTGQNTATQTKRYYIIDQMTGVYMGWYLDLAVGKDGQCIGFNAAVMTDKEPAEYNQVVLSELWAKETQSDPLGLAIQVKTRNKWGWDDFDQIYRTFRIGGKDVFITGSMNGIQMLGSEGTDSITFTGSPGYQTHTLWGSGYEVDYDCTSVIINGGDFNPFTITGLPQVSICFRVKAGNAILSMVSNGKEIDSSWWSHLEGFCPADKKQNLQAWLLRMPNGMFNSANINDTLDSIPYSRFYFHSSKYQAKIPTEQTVWTVFQSATNTDTLGLYTAATTPEFNLENFIAKEQRTCWISGRQITVQADATGIKWTDKDGYYIQVKIAPTVGNAATFYNQNQQIIYQASNTNWYFGAPGVAAINTTAGYTTEILLCAKEKNLLLSLCMYLDKEKIDALITAAPAGREADLRSVFEHLPKDWENTLNQDTLGNNYGTREGRFWMQGGI